VHDLESHAALERFPHRLVDQAHAPFADRPEDAVIAQPLGKDAGGVTGDRGRPGRTIVGIGCAGIALRWARASRTRPGAGWDGRAAHRAELLDFDQRGEQLADLVRTFGAASRVFLHARPFAAPHCRLERFRQLLDRIASGARTAHHCNSSIPTGNAASISLSPFGARWFVTTATASAIPASPATLAVSLVLVAASGVAALPSPWLW